MSEEKETWKESPDFPNYAFSNMGRIKVISKNRILVLPENPITYVQKTIRNNQGELKAIMVHIQVAKLFIPNPENKPEVNHKDKNISNNRVENLEWVTRAENLAHSIAGRESKLRGRKFDRVLFDNTFVPFPISGLEEYMVNPQGVCITKTGRIIGAPDRVGYIRIKAINKNTGVKYNSTAHRIVAMAFIPNPENKPYVNHKNGNKQDNRVENLEWVTQSENCQHAVDNGLRITQEPKVGRHIYQLELDGSIIKEWDSVLSATTGIHEKDNSTICSVCRTYDNGDNKGISTSGGYGWCWVESYTGKKLNESLIRIFPDILELENFDRVDFDILRPYVQNKRRPMWQISLDGTRVKLWNKVSDTKINNISNALKNKSVVGGYTWTYATSVEVSNPDDPYEKIPIKKFRKYEYNDEIDLSLLQNSGNSRPIWELDLDGKRVKKWESKGQAERFYNLDRGQIDNVCRGRGILVANRMWETATPYLSDNNEPGTYRVIPYKDRTINRYQKGIDQYDLHGNLLNSFATPFEAYNTLRIPISLSYKTRENFVFETRDGPPKPKRSPVVQMNFDQEFDKALAWIEQQEKLGLVPWEEDMAEDTDDSYQV